MKSILQRIRMGDFWWYSLMIFMAARAADCPKYLRKTPVSIAFRGSPTTNS